MEELKSIKLVIRWGKNGRKYIWKNPTKKKIAELIKKYGMELSTRYVIWLCGDIPLNKPCQ